MKKRVLIYLGVPVAIATVAFIVAALNPLRRDSTAIQDSLLRETPLGTSYDDVYAFAKEKKWLDLSYVQHNGNRGFYRSDNGRSERTGVRSIMGELGTYSNLFRTTVYAYWGFDENGKLIDIWVHKITEGV